MNKLIILSGAGLSADSGIPTFRSENGLWMNHNIDEVCNYLSWKRNFDLVHNFYNNLRQLLGTVDPNPAHHMIAEWHKRWGTRVVNLTANIDDLLERAGCSNVVHLHGSLQAMKCFACGDQWNIGYNTWDISTDRCANCNSSKSVKPAVVFLHENAPLYSVLHKTFRELTNEDVVLVIGTSGTVINVNALLFDKKCFSVLNNLQAEASIDASIYNVVHYDHAANSVEFLDKIISEKML
jgi:NAD-dependent deacetylase